MVERLQKSAEKWLFKHKFIKRNKANKAEYIQSVS